MLRSMCCAPCAALHVLRSVCCAPCAALHVPCTHPPLVALPAAMRNACLHLFRVPRSMCRAPCAMIRVLCCAPPAVHASLPGSPCLLPCAVHACIRSVPCNTSRTQQAGSRHACCTFTTPVCHATSLHACMHVVPSQCAADACMRTVHASLHLMHGTVLHAVTLRLARLRRTCISTHPLRRERRMEEGREQGSYTVGCALHRSVPSMALRVSVLPPMNLAVQCVAPAATALYQPRYLPCAGLYSSHARSPALPGACALDGARTLLAPRRSAALPRTPRRSPALPAAAATSSTALHCTG